MTTDTPAIDAFARSRHAVGASLLALGGAVAFAPVPVGWGLPLLLASASGIALLAWRRWAGTPVLGDLPGSLEGRFGPGDWLSAVHYGYSGNVGLVPLGATPAGRPVWLPASAVCEPMLVVGPDAARRDAILGIAEAALATGSGFAHIDDGRNPGAVDALASLAAGAGREEDVLVLDLCRSGLGGASHRYNPLRSASPTAMQRLLREALARERGSLPPHWDERADLLLLAVLGIVADARDRNGTPVSLGGIRQALRLPGLLKALDYGKDYAYLTPSHHELVKTYLDTLPGYDFLRGKRQPAATVENHASAMLPLDAGLAFLSARLGGVLDGPGGDIDMADVIANRRILLVRLPGGTADDAETRLVARYVLGGLLGEAAALRERETSNWTSPLFPVFLDGVEDVLGASLRDWTRALDGAVLTVHAVSPSSDVWSTSGGRHLLGLPTVLLRGGGFGSALVPAPATHRHDDALLRGRDVVRLAPSIARIPDDDRPGRHEPRYLVRMDAPTKDVIDSIRGEDMREESYPPKDAGSRDISDLIDRFLGADFPDLDLEDLEIPGLDDPDLDDPDFPEMPPSLRRAGSTRRSEGSR